MGRLFVVIGGCGFLGRHVVDQLVERGERVRVVDLRNTMPERSNVEFVCGNICDAAGTAAAVRGAGTVIHTASPPHGLSHDLYVSVNVGGTRNVIDACVQEGVKQLIFTSSASVVFDGRDIRGGDESLPYCAKHLDGYTETKEQAERLVLAANGKGGLLTIALRPSGIFGPGDAQGWPGFIEAARSGKSKYQLGAGENLMDWTYVGNVAYAHVLAADKLVDGAACAGEAYFVTNDEPIPFWDMAKFIWRELGYPLPSIVVPYALAYYLAIMMDWIVWLLSPIRTIHPTFTYFRVVYAGAHRYFTIDKVKRDLGYAPPVPLDKAMKITAESFQHMRNGAPADKRA